MASESSSIDDLVQAGGDGRIDDVRVHLSAGVIDVNGLGKYNDTTWRLTPLIAACRKGHIEIAVVLLEHGADVNARDERGATGLIDASQDGHSAIVSFLLSKGADVNAKDPGGWTALIAAASESHAVVVSILLNHGAEVDVQNVEG